MSREQIIDKHRNLFWYIPEDRKHDISDALLVERILNDGTLDDYHELVNVLGGKRVAEIFFSAKGRQKSNYYPEIYHFFSLVLKHMHSEILNDRQSQLLPLMAQFRREYYLVGGTAIREV